jgi:hypothetical protein
MAIHSLAQELSAVKDFWSAEKSGEDKAVCTLGGIVIMFFIEPFALFGLLLQKRPNATLSLWK